MSHQGDHMKITILISRILLGTGFFVFGLNILYPFLTSPPPPEGSLAAQFVAVMVPIHWMAYESNHKNSSWAVAPNYPSYTWRDARSDDTFDESVRPRRDSEAIRVSRPFRS